MKKVFFCLIFLFVTNIVNAETYLAKQDVNVRSGPGSKYDLLGVILSGEKVEVIDVNGKWAKIAFNGNQEGYVSINFIQQDAQTSPINSNTESKDSLGFFDYIMYVLFSIVAFTLYRFVEKFIGTSYECSKCNQHRRFFNEPKLFRGKCPEGGLHRWYLD